MSVCRCGMESFGLSGCYHCLKLRVDWSTHPPASNGLSLEERVFVGLSDRRPRDGWRSADGWVNSLEPDLDLDPARVAMLRILIRIGGMDELPSV